jgi:hypothetical protein
MYFSLMLYVHVRLERDSANSNYLWTQADEVDTRGKAHDDPSASSLGFYMRHLSLTLTWLHLIQDVRKGKTLYMSRRRNKCI